MMISDFPGKNEADRPSLKVAVLAAESSGQMPGGAERFYKGLHRGLCDLGVSAEIIAVPADESTFDSILRNYEYCARLDLSSFDVVISTKAPTYAVRHPRHVLYLVHTVRVFDDMFEQNFPHPAREHFLQRAKLHRLDWEGMSHLHARFAIGHQVAKRLYRWRGMRAEVLHPPLEMDGFAPGPQGDYFFLPGRLHPWKRVDLVIESVRRSALPLRLVIAGTGEDEGRLRRISGDDPRIEFAGRVDDQKLLELYGSCLAVPFVPLREDYGYVTLEAFASGKPVLTCADSGEPAHFVKNYQNGLIARSDPDSVKDALEWLFENRQAAREMGERGAESISGMSWAKTASRLLEAALSDAPGENFFGKESIPATVLDMQPIDPPVGGGRLRLLGLYHGLGKNLKTSYVGTYDWPGEKYRRHFLSEGLEETDVPLSSAHHAASLSLSASAGGKTVIDIAFGMLGHLSPKYVDEAKRAVRGSEIVIFSHPWVFPLVEHEISPVQYVVYDSHNVEGYLRAQLLDEGNPAEKELLRYVVQVEKSLGERADLIFTCSHEDLLRFNRLYGFPVEKMRIVPNGVMAFSNNVLGKTERAAVRRRLGISKGDFLALFIGSPYKPNREAALFILEQLAPLLPDTVFVIAGGVGNELSCDRENVVITGQLDEAGKSNWLNAADIAINPMFSGSGTNIKMFDFMVFSLPAVTTAKGARGIDTACRNPFMIVEPEAEAFAGAIEKLRDPKLRACMGESARTCAEEGYAWERISNHTGQLLTSRYRLSGESPPLFSVVVPTYERHEQLETLMKDLQNQAERDFEVIIVDQSSCEWRDSRREFGMPLMYIQSPVKGAVRARNSGAAIAGGRILVFVDDDCLPKEDWLLNARKYFLNPSVVALEGKILSDHLNEPEWRPVTNIGFEGIGFMTANLFVLNRAFRQIGGFDLRFDHPHFREDTDLGWRLQELGLVPYARDVEVFHPAQPRSQQRESAGERVRFFQKDALLYQKNPGKYRRLFFKEGHFKKTAGFKENLIKGFIEAGIPIPEWMTDCFTGAKQ